MQKQDKQHSFLIWLSSAFINKIHLEDLHSLPDQEGGLVKHHFLFDSVRNSGGLWAVIGLGPSDFQGDILPLSPILVQKEMHTVPSYFLKP